MVIGLCIFICRQPADRLSSSASVTQLHARGMADRSLAERLRGGQAVRTRAGVIVARARRIIRQDSPPYALWLPKPPYTACPRTGISWPLGRGPRAPKSRNAREPPATGAMLGRPPRPTRARPRPAWLTSGEIASVDATNVNPTRRSLRRRSMTRLQTLSSRPRAARLSPALRLDA